jgi:hypothetical protein
MVLQGHLASASMHVELKVLVVDQHVHVLVQVGRHPTMGVEHSRQVVEYLAVLHVQRRYLHRYLQMYLLQQNHCH